MDAIGIRELKQRTSDVLRRVRERGETVEISYRGKIVARIVPATRRAVSTTKARKVWHDIDQVAEEIAKRWPRGVSAVRALRETRRG